MNPAAFRLPHRPRLRSSPAFTLVELLVVVGIVAILAAVLFAAGRGALRSAQEAGCLSNMHQLGAAILAYAGDNDGDYPLADNAAWDVPLIPYIGVTSTAQPSSILKCPADTRPLNGGPGRFARSYSFNPNLPNKTTQINSAEPLVMLAEWYSGGTTGPGGAGANFQYGGRFDIVDYTLGPAPAPPGQKGYHGTTSTFLFTDGHAANLDPNQPAQNVPNLWTSR